MVGPNDINRFKYFRTTKLTGMDNGQYFIGFAKECVCGKPPSPCICKPKSVTNGVESGDIFFDRKSYCCSDTEEWPTFEFISELFKRYPIILGYKEDDAGRKNSGKKILKWKIPKISIRSRRLPAIDIKKDTRSRRTSPQTQVLVRVRNPVHSLKKIKPKNLDRMKVHAAAFVPTDPSNANAILKSFGNRWSNANNANNETLFSSASGTIVSETWRNSNNMWIDSDVLAKESRLHKWIGWDTRVPILAGIHPPLLDTIGV